MDKIEEKKISLEYDSNIFNPNMSPNIFLEKLEKRLKEYNLEKELNKDILYL